MDNQSFCFSRYFETYFLLCLCTKWLRFTGISMVSFSPMSFYRSLMVRSFWWIKFHPIFFPHTKFSIQNKNRFWLNHSYLYLSLSRNSSFFLLFQKLISNSKPCTWKQHQSAYNLHSYCKKTQRSFTTFLGAKKCLPFQKKKKKMENCIKFIIFCCHAFIANYLSTWKKR